jgi:alpha 1,3-glucosidase
MGLDIAFPGSDNVYGLPEHASNFSLKTTRYAFSSYPKRCRSLWLANSGPKAEHKDPYRLYNLDVFEFELDSPMALYGSIPFMMSHKKGHSVGVFWMNAAEMWVDVEKASEGVCLFFVFDNTRH